MSASNAIEAPQDLPISSFSEEYLTTKEFASLLKTNPSVIKQSRSSGVLFNRKPPLHIRFSDRKLLYRLSEITRWIDSYPTSAITTHAEETQLAAHREAGALS